LASKTSLPFEIRQAEQFVSFDAKLPKILQGKSNRGHCRAIGSGRLCVLPCRRFYAAAARFYREAFAAEPKLADDLYADHRYNAACASALAGCGQGSDAANLASQESSACAAGARLAAADLAAWQILLKKGTRPGPHHRAKAMRHWQQDTDFAGVRGDKPWPNCRRPNARSGGVMGGGRGTGETCRCNQQDSAPHE